MIFITTTHFTLGLCIFLELFISFVLFLFTLTHLPPSSNSHQTSMVPLFCFLANLFLKFSWMAFPRPTLPSSTLTSLPLSSASSLSLEEVLERRSIVGLLGELGRFSSSSSESYIYNQLLFEFIINFNIKDIINKISSHSHQKH